MEAAEAAGTRPAGLFDEHSYKLALAIVANSDAADRSHDRELLEYLLASGVARSTAFQFTSELRGKLEISAREYDGSTEQILVLTSTQLEVLPDHLINSRLSTALAQLEYDATFDYSSASNKELAERVR